MAKKRSFGRIRQLRSGRWQARYPGPDGIDRPAPYTFERKRDAQVWLTNKEAEILRDDWIDPDAAKVGFKDYAEAWVRERPNLRPKTVELYDYLLRLHLLSTFGGGSVADVREAHVRRWRRERLDSGVSAVTVAKSYRLLKSIMSTAVDDRLIRRNPCRIKGAGQESSPERPVLSVEQVYAVADAVPPRYRGLVLLATFGSLRWGEAIALRRGDLDLEARTVRVERQGTEIVNGDLITSSPKTAAGKRTVTIPEVIVPDLRWQLERFAQRGQAGLVFTAPQGGPLRRSNFRRVWAKAIKRAGAPGVRFHDLRHTGNTMTAAAGASLRELMERMGHASSRAALLYQHATNDRHRAIAGALGAYAKQELQAAKDARTDEQSGTQRARGDGEAS